MNASEYKKEARDLKRCLVVSLALSGFAFLNGNHGMMRFLWVLAAVAGIGWAYSMAKHNKMTHTK